MKKCIIVLISLWGTINSAQQEATFSGKATFTPGWVSTLEIVPDAEINLTANPLSFTVPEGVSITSVWGLTGAPTRLTTENNIVTVTTGNKWWPTTDPLLVASSFTLSFAANSNQFDITDFKIGGISVPVTVLVNAPAYAAPAGPAAPSDDHPSGAGATASTASGASAFTHLVPIDPSVGYLSLDNDKNIFEPYVDITLNPITYYVSDSLLQARYNIRSSGYNSIPIGLLDVVEQSNIKGVRLAFITENGPADLSWGGNPLDFAAPIVQKLQSNKIKVVISLGGAIGMFPGSTIGTYESFHTFLTKVLSIYPGVGLCFDLENAPLYQGGGLTDPNIRLKATNLMKAAYDIQNEFSTPLVLTLPVLPEGLTQGGKDLVKIAHDAGLNFKINLMAMDYGDSYNDDMYRYASSAANATAGYLHSLYTAPHIKPFSWCLSRVQVTPMIGYNDVVSEKFSLTDARHLVEWAKANNVSISMWSLTRDNPARSQELVSPLHSGPGQQTTPYEFSRIFQQIDQQ